MDSLLKEITLKKVVAYKAYSSDGYVHTIMGYYRSSASAEIEGKKHQGGFEREELFTDGSKLYEIKCVANYFADDIEGVIREQIESIKRKLTPSELELLGIK